VKYEFVELQIRALEERISAGEDAIANQKIAVALESQRGGALGASDRLAQLELEQSRLVADWYKLRRDLAGLAEQAECPRRW
jgi:hypothetical protein